MKRFAFLLPSLCFVLTACPGDGGGGTGETGDSDGDEDSNTTGSGTVTLTTSSTTMDMSTTTDMPTTTEPSTSGLPECTEEDECINDEDCPLPGASCVACLCSGGEGCEMYGPGAFGDCGNEGIAACMGSVGAGCFADPPADPVVSVCVSSCKETCDCPQPPAGFEAQLSCEDVFTGEGDECIISCASNEECPDGWSCYAATFCVNGIPPTLDPYGDCANLPGACPPETDGGAGICPGVPAATDESTGEGAVCSTIDCADVDDCPAMPATGTATVGCDPLTMGGDPNCYLDCSGGETCPDDMVCHPEIGVCYWETVFLDPYSECLAPEIGVCPDGPTGGVPDCLRDEEETISWCTNACADVDDCHAAPATGNAPVDCVTIGMIGDFCVLDCGDGQTCPDDMVCSSPFCVNPVP